MSLFNILGIAGTALHAESVRMNTTASNMANANSASSSVDTTYRARHPLFASIADDLLRDPQALPAGVRVDRIIEDQSPLKKEYHPGHPLANADGYIFLPNVNTVEEMANMISASRSYQSNLEVISTSKLLLQRTLTLGQ